VVLLKDLYTFLMMQCGLCQNRVEESATKSVSGLTVCKDCLSTDALPSRLASQGLHLSYAYLTNYGMVSPNEKFVFDSTEHKLSALGVSPNSSSIDALLVHEGFKAKVTKIFAEEIQVGDSDFDPKVWIRTDTPEETGAFLRLSGVKSVLLKLIDMQSEINIHGAKIYVITHGSLAIDVKQFILQTGILLHYLSEFSRP